MKRLHYILFMLAVVLMGSCRDIADIDKDYDLQENGFAVSGFINGTLAVENSNVYGKKSGDTLPRLATRALIDQITAKRMDSNFLRIDEDIDKNSNDGKYTFTGNEEDFPSTRVNWEKAYITEAIVVSSPDNTKPDPTIPDPELQGGYFRSVSFDPIQSYNILVQSVKDTTHFYHTRMVGWYPRNCHVPRDIDGKAANAMFDNSAFNGKRIIEKVDINGTEREVVAVQFTELDGSVDLMVSNVREGQHWHRNDGGEYTHRSNTHNGVNVYREPFGYNASLPKYSNFFTYRHYLSAVRVYVRAEKSEQVLSMWGDITGLRIMDQPTSVKVWLPDDIDQFGGAYGWSDIKTWDIQTGALFGDDSNHPDIAKEKAEYPIRLAEHHTIDNLYLGYSLIKPEDDLKLELHTTSGIYRMSIDEGAGTEESPRVFKAGYVYNVIIDLGTDGTIAAIIDDDSKHRYYDLTSLTELDLNGNEIQSFRHANCYVIETSDERRLKVKDKNGNPTDVEYHGYAFNATVVGNGEAGILSSGIQTMYPKVANISPTYASLIWTDSYDLVSNIELMYDYVRFNLRNPKDKEGNAVIGVFDDNNNILWSWHIWVTPELNTQSFKPGDNTEDNALSPVITILDRNLGATRAKWTSDADALKTYGLYYQWGRKDPSPGPKEWNYSIRSLITAPYYDFSMYEHNAAEVFSKAQPTLRDGVENPMYLIMPNQQTQSYYFNWTYERFDFLWGFRGNDNTAVHKTIYDPCPFGYRVATSALKTLAYDVHRNGDINTNYILDTYGQIFRHQSPTDEAGNSISYENARDGIYFPYTGYKGVDRTMNSHTLSWKYVGEKADYQDATINLMPGTTDVPNANYLARGRLYLSKEPSWTETSVGSYSGYYIIDFANRRTASPVRCVKDEPLAVVLADITSKTDYIMPNSGTESATHVILECAAESYSSNIKRVRLVLQYETIGEGGTKIQHEIMLKDKTEGLGATYWTNEQKSFDVSSYIDETTELTFILYVTNEHNITAENQTTVKVIQYDVDTDYWVENPTYPNTDVTVSGLHQLKNGWVHRGIIVNGNVDPADITSVRFRKVSKDGVAVSDEWHDGGVRVIDVAPDAKYETSVDLYYEFAESEPGEYVYEYMVDIQGTSGGGILKPFIVEDWNMEINVEPWSKVYKAGGGELASQMAGATVMRKVKLTNFSENIKGLVADRSQLSLIAKMNGVELTVTRDDAASTESEVWYNIEYSKNAAGSFNDITLEAYYLLTLADTEQPAYSVTGLEFDTSMWGTAYSDAACTVPVLHIADMSTPVYRKFRVYGNANPAWISGCVITDDIVREEAIVVLDSYTDNAGTPEGQIDRTYVVKFEKCPGGTHAITANINWNASVGGGSQSAVMQTVVSHITIDDKPFDKVYSNINGTAEYPFQLAGNDVYRKIRVYSNATTTSQAKIKKVMVNGVEATLLAGGSGANDYLDQTYIVKLNETTKGTHAHPAVVTWGADNEADCVTTTINVSCEVWAVDDQSEASTSLVAGVYYVIANRAFDGYHLRATSANGNLQGSNGTIGYESIFQVSGATSGGIITNGTITSVLHGTKATESGSNIVLGNSGESYTFSGEGSETYLTISSRAWSWSSWSYVTSYWKQASGGANVTISSSESNNPYWYFYLVTKEE